MAPEAAQADRELDRKQSGSGKAAPAQDLSPHPLASIFNAIGADGSDSSHSRMVSSPLLQRRANGAMRIQLMRHAQQGAGNFKTQQWVTQLKRSAVIQRECACGGTCASCQEKGVEEEESTVVQRQANASAPGAPDDEIVPEASPGQPLDRDTRNFMEPRFGHNFSEVRVHTDTAAARSADALAANAYTTGRDIYFAAGKYAPATSQGQHLLAHELTHTVQQANGAVSAEAPVQSHSVVVGSPDSPLETEAEQTAHHVLTSPAQPVSISSDKGTPIRRGILGDAWDATGGRVVNYVGGKIEAAAEWTEDWIISKVEKYAPGLLKLLRGDLVGFIKDKIADGLDAIFGGITSLIPKDGFLGAAANVIGGFIGGIEKAASGMVAGACEAFAHAAEAITSVVKAIAGPTFEVIKTIASAVGTAFSFIWDKLVKPAYEAIKGVAQTVWGWIESTAKWIWEKTEPIRRTLGRVWRWILDKFGVAWDAGGSVLDWLKEKAAAAWDKIYDFIKPVIGPLKIIGTGLLLISPLGPIILIWKAAPHVWDALTWLYQQWKKTDFIVAARNVLTEHILPAIVSGAETIANLLESAANWIAEKVDSVNSALGGLLNAVGASAILSLIRKTIQFVADEFRKFANWVKNDFVKTLRKIKEVVLKILNFLKPILLFLVKLAIVVANPILLPIVLTGYLWQILPACFKPPIIDFVLDLLIGVVRALPTFKIFGEAWPPAKAKILGAMTQLRTSPVEKKIEASNRVARIMSGDDLEWLGNLLSAMIKVPDYIEGQFEEELIGMDLTQPLPFERAAPPGIADTVSQNVAAGTLQPENAAVLSNPNLAAGQIGVDQVSNLELEPELIADLQAHGSEQEYRGPDDPSRTIGAIQKELAGQAPTGQAPAGTTAAPQGPGPATASPTPAGPATSMSTDQQLEDYMNQQPAPDTCTKAAPAKEDTSSQIPESMKIGPLTRGQRARYLLHQIGQGIKTWFKCNSTWLIPAIIGVIAALVALEILTGGAVTAALPAILDIFTAIMIGVAAARAASYTAEYVTKAVSGDVAGAAKSLARGLAIVGIELIFALLFNIDKVINTLKQGLKATAEAAAKAAKAAVKGTIESVEKLGRIAVEGAEKAGRNIAGLGRAIVRNGKLLLEGVGEGFAKGIRKVKDLFERLWNKLRFKAFRIRIAGGWVELEGEINPWVLIARWKISWIAEAGATAKSGVAWVRDVLKLPAQIVKDLALEAIERLRTLPEWILERLSGMTENALKSLLGCESPCKVDLQKIIKYFESLTAEQKAGAKVLKTVQDVLDALPEGLNVAKIKKYLGNHPALMKLIERAGITDVDLAYLSEFLTAADAASQKTAYQTFTKYLTQMIPSKTGAEIAEINELAAALIEADARQGSALKGPIFEAFVKQHVAQFVGKNLERAVFKISKTSSRVLDFFERATGEVWQFKHQLSQAVRADEVADYASLIGRASTDGDVARSINYLFATKEAAELNRGLIDKGFRVWFIEDGAKLVRLGAP